MPHYMQSAAFGEYMAHLNWQTVTLGSKQQPAYLYIHKVPLIGTVAKMPKVIFPLPIEELVAYIQKYNIQLCRIEPNVILPQKQEHETMLEKYTKNCGFRPSWLDGELTTLVVDLTRSEDKMFATIPRENTRRNIRAAIKNGLKTQETDDIELLISLHRKLAKQKHFFAPSEAELKAIWQAFSKIGEATIVVIRDKQHIPQAAIFLIIHQQVAYYRYVGYEDTAEVLRAPSLAVWECLLTAKRHGAIRFDFLGITDPRRKQKRWEGFTHFKKGFSNTSLRYISPKAYYKKPFGPFLQLMGQFG